MPQFKNNGNIPYLREEDVLITSKELE